MITGVRLAIAALSLSAAALVGIVIDEGYSDKAIPDPVLGANVPTLGFGSTGADITMSSTTTPVKALGRALEDIQKFEGAIKRCVRVPLHQREYDAYLNFAYNVGAGAFCGSTLVRLLNAGDHEAACRQMGRWTFVGKTDCRRPGSGCRGIVLRREKSITQCLGQ